MKFWAVVPEIGKSGEFGEVREDGEFRVARQHRDASAEDAGPQLSPRQSEVLRAVVGAWVGHAQPVASETVAQLLPVAWSPATVRSTLAELAELGLVTKPHVSAGRFPTEEDQRTLTSAGDSIDEYLLKLIGDRYPQAQISIFMVRQWKEQHGFVGKPQGRVEVTAPVAGRPTQFDITDALRTACESIVAPVTETMLDLLPKVEPEFQAEVRNNILLAGGVSQLAGLRPALEKALEPLGGGKVKAVKDPVFCGSDGGLAIALDALDTDWEKVG